MAHLKITHLVICMIIVGRKVTTRCENSYVSLVTKENI